jgi:hypothetical protein
MLPFYFLTILLNGITGYILAFSSEEIQDENGFSFNFSNGTFRLVVGCVSILTGLLKILSPVPGNIPVVGDIVPALANIGGGFILVFDYYRNRSTLASEAADKLGDFIGANRKRAGFISLGAAVLHFIFYPVLFL